MAIPQTFDDAFERTKQLVSIFSENEGKYLSPGYSEAQARLEFIDKFWIALGWDVNRETQHDPYRQEVQVERGIATSEFRKRADYAFLAPNFRDVRFFVEAKKPHAGIDSPEFYFQTLRYGWNSHTPLAVLTDFEELRVLDCRYKPDIRSALGHAVLKFHYHDYADKEKFRTIYYLFSREAVLNGSIENFAKGMPKLSRKGAQRGVSADAHQSIDESFLQELDDFREELARAYKRKNPGLDSAELTEVTQRTLDRLVFMRFLEDKLIEAEPLIEDLHKPGHSWENFISTSRRLDRIYNGIIFKEHTLLDSDSFKADERVFDKISQSLSHAGSPYDFNAIPIHILGSIYERFLGKVIVATDKRARVEEKPEVRKAGGVYYTPEYIVRYIVDNTVGKLIEGKKPAEIQEMRFADIACGSGSFLLGVYDTLLRYHTAYYNRTKRNRTEGVKAGCIQRPDGALQLSLLQKRQILLNNIYGVDIDLQAVEVAQLSLYLKLLEDETIASAHQQQLALKQALLPSLSKNIVCGNSLIGWDIVEGKLFDTADVRGLNPMNFEDAFPEVMKLGGFDAIVGNPPYIRMEGFVAIKHYFRARYVTHSDRADIFYYFLERAVSLIRPEGRLGYIVSNTFSRSRAGESLRQFLLENLSISILAEFGDFTPFIGATVYPLILVGAKSKTGNARVPFAVQDFDPLKAPNEPQFPTAFFLEGDALTKESWVFEDSKSLRLRSKLLDGHPSLREKYGPARMGIKSGLNEAFIISDGERKQIITANQAADDIIRPFVTGEDLDRYLNNWRREWMIYTPHGIDMSLYPAVLTHLEKHKPALKNRATRQQWYELQQPQEAYSALMDKPKIIYPDMSRYPKFSLDDTGVFFSNTVYFIASSSSYLLGLLNSKLLWFVVRGLGNALRGGLWRFRLFSGHVERLPIRVIDLSEPTDKERHERMVQFVDQMLEAKKQLAAARSEGDKNFYESKCATLDRQIDNLVYELYDLTPEEIAIIEASGQ